mgnify:CR=1 FL=1
MKNETLQQVIEYYGSQAKLAELLGVTRAAVTQWVNDGGLPPLRAIQIEVMSGGDFKAVDLTNNKKDSEE